MGDLVNVSFDVDRAFHARLSKAIPWGIKGELMRRLLSMVVEVVEKHGEAAIGVLLSGEFEIVPKYGAKKGKKI